MEQQGILTVQANLSFKERVARGSYFWPNVCILAEDCLPVTAEQIGDWQWKLFRFDRSVSSKEAIRLMKEKGYDAGQIGHLLAFGEQYLEEQRNGSIIALGSVAKNEWGRNAIKVDSQRRLEVTKIDRFLQGVRFLGVRRYFQWRQIRHTWFDKVWDPDDRSLGVRRHSA